MRYLEDIAQERLIVSDLKLDQIFFAGKMQNPGRTTRRKFMKVQKKKIQQVGGWNTIE